MDDEKLHRFEKLRDRAVVKMGERVDMLSKAMMMGVNRPPFAQKLTEREQLEQYAAMTPEKWDAMQKSMGLAKTREYSLEMQQLVKRWFGDTRPATLLVPGDQMQQPQDGSSPQPPQQGQSPQQLSFQPQGADVQAQADSIVDQALNSVGLNRGMFNQ